MSESFRTTPPEPPWSSSPSNPGNGHRGFEDRPAHDDADAGETGKVLLIGVLGGLLSAAGYMIYRRLPDDQKDRLHGQVRSAVQSKINEIRQNFNI